MVFWNGSSWITIDPGQEGQNLTFCNGTPIWGPCPELPTVSTLSGTNATENSIEFSGLISNNGGAVILDKGFVWNTSVNPTINENGGLLSLGSGSDGFSGIISNLQTSTTYYIRAYGENSVGYSYGNVIEFTPELPIQIGDFHQGGYVIYLASNGYSYGPNGPESGSAGQHGIILRPGNIGSNPVNPAFWGCSTPNTSFNFTSTNVGYAEMNTNIIIEGCGVGNAPAVESVNNYSVDGYNDWFLPTSGELSLIHNAMAFLPSAAISSNIVYWSSSFCGASSSNPTVFRAYEKNFEQSWNGTSCENISLNYRRVFAIRYF